MKTLAPGVILRIASSAGVKVLGRGNKRRLRCPFHEDNNPSAFISLTRNVFYCSVCCGRHARGWSAKRFAQEVGVPWNRETWTGSVSLPGTAEETLALGGSRPPTTGASSVACQSGGARRFTAKDASAVWDTCLARTRDDSAIDGDENLYAFLWRRQVSATWEERLFGILPPEPHYSPILEVGSRDRGARVGWATAGYRLVCPLYCAENGEISNIQARYVGRDSPAAKTMFPEGSRAKGTVFANAPGLRTLNGLDPGQTVIFGEGLTDYLSLALVSPCPVVAAPGAGMALAGVAGWATGRCVLVATDNDKAGDAPAAGVAKRIRQFGGRALRLRWPKGLKDANDVLVAYGLEWLAEFLTRVVTRGKA